MSTTQSAGRTVLVTGAAGGIGYETARRLVVDEHAHVVLHARTAQDAEDAQERLVKGGVDPLLLSVTAADLADLDEVAAMARFVMAGHPRVDVLVNNAAVAAPEGRTLTRDGHELTFQVNYLAPYLLTRLLEPALVATGKPRVVNVSSSLHRSGSLNWTDLNRSQHYSRHAVYAQSKLALTLFTKGLAEFGPHGLTAISVHPGIVDTGLLPLYSHVGRPVTDAAAVVARMCSSDTQVLNGAYYDELLPGTPSPMIGDRRAMQRLDKLSARLTGQL
ncbi:SDR family NAD(P)-dependent oxidoreductase [Kutzneria sp. CA-103260]|uniref:SDR family NAD(P)-dependent oxidoreductase n=1 Tax=Kutzneria sp. CA-103260 TaxID=2802641 RepID=UPI001BA5D12B|nr:SDR family NAD(P)-dependent oxidoreductase [Kutzneria sp. CA-103260]QUQ64397.1 short chain dehydrogenase [Kutzneria sp. CA-103260]